MDLFGRSVNRLTWPDSNRRPLLAKHVLSLVSYTALRQILCGSKIAPIPCATAVPSKLSLHPRPPRFSHGETYLYVLLPMEEPGRFHTQGISITNSMLRFAQLFPSEHWFASRPCLC